MGYQDILNDIANSQYSLDQLRDVVANAPVTANNAAEGATTILYSGKMPDGTHTGTLAEAMSSASVNGDGLKQVVTIADTDAYKILQSKELGDAVDRATSSLPPDEAVAARSAFFDGVTDTNGHRQPGVWDDVSRRLVESAEGDVRTIVSPDADPSRVFAQTEVKAALDNPKVTSIDGVPKEDFARLFNAELSSGKSEAQAIESVFDAVKGKSTINATHLRYGADVHGNIHVDSKHFFSDTPHISGSGLPPGTLNVKSLVGLHERLPGSAVEALTKAGRLAEKVGKSGLLNKLGTAGDILGLALAASNAIAANEAGDSAAAADIMIDWAAGFAGGLAGGLAAAKLAAMATSGLALTGPVGLLIAGVLTLGAGFAGALLGEEVALWISNTLFPPPVAPQGADDVLGNIINPGYGSPLILDLDGDGVETVSEAAGVQFDLDNNGFAETVGWASADDGLLAFDKNNNGRVDNGNELFGNHTTRANGDTASNGFIALADYDENGDGVINSSDNIFSNLRIWRDLNGNGVSETNELQGLNEAGVASLNLANSYSNAVDEQGNEHRQLGTYVDSGGNTHDMTDVWFSFDPTRTTPVDSVIIPDGIQSLPNALGFGTVRSLHESMVLDESGRLQSLVEQFVAEIDPVARRELLPQLMYQWVGGKNAHMDDGYFTDAWANPRGAYFFTGITQEQYTVLEAFLGTEKFFNNEGAARQLYARYEQLCDIVFYQLMSQTHLRNYYELINFSFDEDTQTWRGDYSLAAATIATQAIVNESWDNEIVTDFLRSVRGMNPYILENSDAVRSTFETIIRSYWQNDSIRQIATTISKFYLGTDAGGESLNASQMEEIHSGILFSGDGDDTIYGANSDLNEVLGGDGGDDKIYGNDGNDVLIGGEGNDSLRGGGGDDSYYFTLGDGQDVIELVNSAEGIDTLVLGETITADNLRLEKYYSDLLIKVGSEGDQVRLAGWFGSTFADKQLDRISFADGTVITMDELLASKPIAVLGTDGDDSYTLLRGDDGANEIFAEAGNDTLQGMAGNDVLYGGSGDDNLRGFDGDDTLIGETGNDTLYGGLGNDRFIFNLGDSVDFLILDDIEGIDTVVFGEGITTADLCLQKDYNNLLIHVGDGGDQLKLVNWFDANYLEKRIDQFSFSDGTVLSREDLLAQLPVLTDGTQVSGNLIGHDGNDLLLGDAESEFLNGSAGDDVISGGAGADTFNGGSGNDQFIFNFGDGQDSINLDDADGFDILSFGDGISTNDIQFYKSGSYDLIVRVGEGGDHVKIRNWYHPSYATKRVDQFLFADGTIWDSAALESLTATPRSDIAPTIGGAVALGAIAEDTGLLITEDALLANAADADGDNLNVINVCVDQGTLVDNGDGSWNYIPDANYNGNALLTYQVTDGLLNMNATADLTVTPVNDAPVASGDVALGTSAGDTGRVISQAELLTTMTDVEGDSLSITGLTVDRGTLIDNGDGSWTYTPESEFSGKVFFAYQATDGSFSVAQSASLEIGEDRNDLIGTQSLNVLNGGEADDYLMGQAGNDTLRGYAGNDVLIGGTGNDTLYGGAGNDVIRFGLGDGQDTVKLDDINGYDSLEFGPGITLEDLTLSKDVYDLLIDIGGDGDQIRIKDWFYAASSFNLDRFVFADGTVLSREEFEAQKTVFFSGSDNADSFYGTRFADMVDGAGGADFLQGLDGDDILSGHSGDDTLRGGSGDDSLSGGDGQDVLEGGDGQDVIHGGSGNDTLNGGAGDDLFCFNLGDGQDTIIPEDANGFDTLLFGEGITANDLTLVADNYDLLINVGTAGDQVRMVSWMMPQYADKRIDNFRFSDGSELSSTALVANSPDVSCQ
ncbi:MAG: cadherin-like domain-containing protein [Syntrophotaleaceae bacterium]